MDSTEIPIYFFFIIFFYYRGKLSRSQYRGHGVLCTGVRQVNHSEVHGKGSKTNAFIRIRLSRLFTTLAVKTKKNTIV